MAQFPANIDLSTLNGTRTYADGFTFSIAADRSVPMSGLKSGAGAADVAETVHPRAPLVSRVNSVMLNSVRKPLATLSSTLSSPVRSK